MSVRTRDASANWIGQTRRLPRRSLEDRWLSGHVADNVSGHGPNMRYRSIDFIRKSVLATCLIGRQTTRVAIRRRARTVRGSLDVGGVVTL
jgi:hypothetical protein